MSTGKCLQNDKCYALFQHFDRCQPIAKYLLVCELKVLLTGGSMFPCKTARPEGAYASSASRAHGHHTSLRLRVRVAVRTARRKPRAPVCTGRWGDRGPAASAGRRVCCARAGSPPNPPWLSFPRRRAKVRGRGDLVDKMGSQIGKSPRQK